MSVKKHGYDTTSVWRSFTAEPNAPDLNSTDKLLFWTLQTELDKLRSHQALQTELYTFQSTHFSLQTELQTELYTFNSTGKQDKHCFMFDLAIKHRQVFIVVQ